MLDSSCITYLAGAHGLGEMAAVMLQHVDLPLQASSVHAVALQAEG